MTTFRPMEPTATAVRRLPEAGRIRLGQQIPTRDGKHTRPTALHTLRFTSPHKSGISALAILYGGVERPWRNGNIDEWEIITDTAEIPVVLPPDPLGDTPIYELWAKGSLQRRCDGEEAVCPKRMSDDEVAMETVPCICNQREQADCKPTTRLAVILPDIPFGGVWRLDTHSWNAADELPGMVAAIQSFSSRGFVRAFFGVRQESKMEAGKKKEFIVPYLRMDTSVQEVLDGAAGLAAIPQPAPLALSSAVLDVGWAKNRLLEVCGGDVAEAKRLWEAQTPRTEAELNDLIEGVLPLCEVEVVDETGRPF